ncbi:hypothetical protein [Rhabdothermincola sp.]|uniref:hypothetical protein n=1 Tax=Rhabdothermincola sp. TaxID=2820405 RepID=UPI002FE1008C
MGTATDDEVTSSGPITSGSIPAPTQAVGPLRDAYTASFEATCRSIWSIAPAGELVDPDDPGTPLTVEDCLADLDPGQGENFADPLIASAGGRADAADVAASLSSVRRLCVPGGGPCWSP